MHYTQVHTPKITTEKENQNKKNNNNVDEDHSKNTQETQELFQEFSLEFNLIFF